MSKIKKGSIIITVILFSLSYSGCKDWLTPNAKSFYTPSNTFKTKEGLNGALVACLRNARHEFYGDGAPLITEYTFSDETVEGTTDKTGPAQDLPAQILPDANLNSVNTNRIGWYWDQGYKRIKYANAVISNIDKPDWDSDEARNNILGKAYFHRARVYYRLTQQFGDVPLILKELTEPKTEFYSVTRESILKKCKKDLEFAAKWVKTAQEGVPIGDINKAAVNHLLTKVNLALLDFDDAIASANAVINDGYHHLMTHRFGVDKNDTTHDVVWDLHQNANKVLAENREGIYLFVGNEQLTEGGASERTSVMRQTVPFWGGAGKIKTPSGRAGMSDQPLGNKVGDGVVKIDLVTKYGRGIGRCRPSPYIQYGLWRNAPNDLRHTYPNWMTMEDMVYNHPNLRIENDPYYGKHLQKYDDKGNVLVTDSIRSWYNWPYYKLYTPDPTDQTPDGGYGNWYAYRLGETYLLRAEAYYWKGNVASAAADINAVRKRANAPLISPGKVNIGTILDERARELFYEEPRKTELTRMAFILAETGKPAYNGKSYNMDNFSEDNFWYDRVIEKNKFYRENVVAPHYTYRAAPWIALWPIPASTIDANLGHINQNKGYPGAEDYQKPRKWVDGEGEGKIVEQ